MIILALKRFAYDFMKDQGNLCSDLYRRKGVYVRKRIVKKNRIESGYLVTILL